jgi:hypothetical protein
MREALIKEMNKEYEDLSEHYDCKRSWYQECSGPLALYSSSGARIGSDANYRIYI